MEIASLFEWIAPTNPLSDLFFGFIFMIIMGFVVWVDTKNLKVVLSSSVAGFIIICLALTVLNAYGYYGQIYLR